MSKELEVLRCAKRDLENLKDLKLEGHTTTIFETTGYDTLKEAIELLEEELTQKSTGNKILEEASRDSELLELYRLWFANSDVDPLLLLKGIDLEKQIKALESGKDD